MLCVRVIQRSGEATARSSRLNPTHTQKNRAYKKAQPHATSAHGRCGVPRWAANKLCCGPTQASRPDTRFHTQAVHTWAVPTLRYVSFMLRAAVHCSTANCHISFFR